MVDFLGRFKKPKRVGGDGELTVFCASEQDGISIDLARWQLLATDVLKAEGVRGAAENDEVGAEYRQNRGTVFHIGNECIGLGWVGGNSYNRVAQISNSHSTSGFCHPCSSIRMKLPIWSICT